MTKIIVLETINLKSSIEKAIVWLDGKTIFLDLPTDVESYIKEIIQGANYQGVLQYMEDVGLIKVEEKRKYRAYEPIFEYIYKNRPIVHCYEDPTHHYLSMDTADEIFVLTAKGRLGWIDLGRWRRVLEDEIKLGIEYLEVEGEFICNRIKGDGVCIGSSDLKDYLKKRGLDARSVEIDRSYLPLDILREEIKEEILGGEKVSDKTMKRFIDYHLRFTDIIIENGFEDAYQIWKEEYLEIERC
ncbi:MAG: hypothetical protein MOIL_01141 [Candidatus Methanolliviera sp. GoM_oil]|nr:MAG: hypothetical protein MOIL_01141 [Candidatus Methanolliviera sp. GoM_oil]